MKRYFFLLLSLTLFLAACGSGDDTSSEAAEASDEAAAPEADSTDEAESADDTEAAEATADFAGPLVIGAIPDQDPEVLARNYDLVANYLAGELGIDVQFEPVTEYEAAVTAFRVGDLDLVWFGGLTGVQARLQVDGAEAIAQRDIDEQFTSVFIASTDSGIDPISSVDELEVVSGRTLTFGSDSSTSGRLMPQSFLSDAGVALEDLNGEPGFSGSHDATIELVEAGTFEVGALNSQVWDARVEAGEVDLDRVQVIFETPAYFDYHWVARAELGGDLQSAVVAALKNLDPDDPDHEVILEFFGAGSFIDTESANYASIESVGREIGQIDG